MRTLKMLSFLLGVFLCAACLAGCFAQRGCATIKDKLTGFKPWEQTTTSSTTTTAATPAESSTLPAANSSGATDAVAVDEIDLSTVTWDDASPAAWPISATLGAVTITSDGLSAASLTGTNDWTRRSDGGEKATVGNWVLVRKCSDGKLHGASIEWLGPGKTRVTGKRWDGTDAIHGCVGSDPAPASGETVYVLASGCIRAGADCGKQRSNAVKALWP